MTREGAPDKSTRTGAGKLFLVATPIGNLGDITYRAVEVLRSADIVCAEDTRRSRILLEAYGIARPLLSYRDHNAARMAPRIAEWVEQGKTVALMSDAGTPAISDPGYRAVQSVLAAGLPIEVIPGATAVTTALVLSGLAVDRFVFEGFLPAKKGRLARLQEIAHETRTIIIFEGPHRLPKTLQDLTDVMGGERRAAVARELTKVFEEVRRGTLSELTEHYRIHPPRGEIVLVVEGLRDADRAERRPERTP